MLVLAIVAQLAAAVPSRLPTADSSVDVPSINVVADTVRRRPRAITYSDAYATRLIIHRIGSYTMLPLFGAEFALGQDLLTGSSPASWVKPTHTAVALGIGALFTVNTVTGAWNLWESRQDPAGRTRRWIHAALLMASDAGFVATGAIAGDAHHSTAAGDRHRNVAIGSMALATAGTVMMWFWKD